MRCICWPPRVETRISRVADRLQSFTGSGRIRHSLPYLRTNKRFDMCSQGSSLEPRIVSQLGRSHSQWHLLAVSRQPYGGPGCLRGRRTIFSSWITEPRLTYYGTRIFRSLMSAIGYQPAQSIAARKTRSRTSRIEPWPRMDTPQHPLRDWINSIRGDLVKLQLTPYLASIDAPLSPTASHDRIKLINGDRPQF